MTQNNTKAKLPSADAEAFGLPPARRFNERKRDDALERYARRHGMDMEQVHREMERCLAEGGSLRRFFNLD